MPAHRSPGGLQRRPYVELAEREPVFADVLARYGDPSALEWHDGGRTGSSQFAALVLHIVSQNTSAVAAFRTYDRLADAAGGPLRPRAVLSFDIPSLRATGLSAAKASYLLALAQAQAAGDIDVEDMGSLDDDAVIAALTAIDGIGLWTAQTFLLHNLKRPDVLPSAELGVRTAVAKLWHLPAVPRPSEVRRRGEAWAPYRSYAAELLWRSLVPPGEPSDQKERALLRMAGTGSVQPVEPATAAAGCTGRRSPPAPPGRA